MATLARAASSIRFGLQPQSIIVSSSRGCGWVRDWKPGPPPKTPEEIAAAARKYNLIPEDYKFYPEETGYGDYPRLPKVGMDARDPYEDFDMYYLRRNYGEPLHIQYDMMTSARHDPNAKWRYPGWQMAVQFFAYIGCFAAAFFFCEYFDITFNTFCKPKQFPGPGKVHYTFEPLDD